MLLWLVSGHVSIFHSTSSASAYGYQHPSLASNPSSVSLLLPYLKRYSIPHFYSYALAKSRVGSNRRSFA